MKAMAYGWPAASSKKCDMPTMPTLPPGRVTVMACSMVPLDEMVSTAPSAPRPSVSSSTVATTSSSLPLMECVAPAARPSSRRSA